jgi:hypothetical protein
MGLFLLFWAVIATITGFIAGGILACLIDDAFNNKMKVSAIIALTSVIMIAMYATVNMKIYHLPSNKERVASFTEAAALHEFSSGSEYPLEIGARSSSATGETSVSGGIFSISAYAKMQAGASILVDYRHGDGTHEVLEIPLSTIKFNIIGDGEMSSMVINLTDLPGAEGYVAKDTLGDCHPHIQWGWWLKECPTIKNTQVTSTIGDEGLAGLFQKALSSNPGKFVTMNVTEAEYQQILGSANTQTETPTPSPTQR